VTFGLVKQTVARSLVAVPPYEYVFDWEGNMAPAR
jgi:hypothetical protein